MAKITYADKSAINQNTQIPDVNKVNASDMNQIKATVNANDDKVGELSSLNTTNKSSIVAAVNEVNSKFVYSTSEQVVGKFLNKPLYRKVISTGNLPNSTYLDIPLSSFSSENKTIINLYCIVMSNDWECLTLPYYAGETNYVNILCTSQKNIRIQASNDRSRFSGYVIVEYTKTTD